jgi:hypothetical protein
MTKRKKSVPDDPPAVALCGRVVKYKTESGEECEIYAWTLDDSGYYFRFHRAGRQYPLRLSKEGAVALTALIQDLWWHSPPVPSVGKSGVQNE